MFYAVQADLWRFDFTEEGGAGPSVRLTELPPPLGRFPGVLRAAPAGRAMSAQWVAPSSISADSFRERPTYGFTEAACYGGVASAGFDHKNGRKYGRFLDDFLTREVGSCADPTCETRTAGGVDGAPPVLAFGES